MATLLKNIGGYDIFVGEDGRFSTNIGRDTLTNKSLKEIEKRINAQLQGVTVLECDVYGMTMREVVVVGKESVTGYRAARWRTKDNTLLYGSQFYCYDPVALQEAQLLSAQAERLRQEYERDRQKLKDQYKALETRLVKFTDAHFTAAQQEAKVLSAVEEKETD